MKANQEGGEMSTVDTTGRWAQLPPESDANFAHILQDQVSRDLQMAAGARVFERCAGHHLSRTPLILDGHGWRDVGDVLEDAIRRIQKIQSDAADRLEHGDEEQARSSALVLMHFETPAD